MISGRCIILLCEERSTLLRCLLLYNLIIYLLMIQITISNVLLKQYDGLIKAFLWNGKKPRNGLRKQCAPRNVGGLVLPDLELYSIAFKMNKLIRHWKSMDSDLGWVKAEKALSGPYNVIQLLSQKSISNTSLKPP